MTDVGLVYVGRIVELGDILGADFIASATAVCGEGGKWRGVVKKSDFMLGDKCMVYLPDAILPEIPAFLFMKSRGYRVRMCKFRGCPSEALIMPMSPFDKTRIGYDMTFVMGVTKYHKPVPENMQGKAKGPFPGFIPKTDELNYQRHPELVEELVGKPYYVTEKADGSSSTAFRYKGEFGVCSRNWELEESDNGFWKIANKYRLKENLPEGIAIQWETIGPKIQGNPMGLNEVDGRAFSAYNIDEQRYLEWKELIALCIELEFPTCCNLINGMQFDSQGLETLGEGTYHLSGKQREGVVVRSQHNIKDGKPISFKVINLNYED